MARGSKAYQQAAARAIDAVQSAQTAEEYTEAAQLCDVAASHAPGYETRESMQAQANAMRNRAARAENGLKGLGAAFVRGLRGLDG